MVWRRCSASSALDTPVQNRSHRDRKRILPSNHRKAYQQGSTEIDGTGPRLRPYFYGSAHVHLPGCRDMKDLTGRLERLEARAGRRSGLSSERRKYLTDRAVLHRDEEALAELNLHRLDTIVGSVEQRAAAIAAGIRVCHEPI